MPPGVTVLSLKYSVIYWRLQKDSDNFRKIFWTTFWKRLQFKRRVRLESRKQIVVFKAIGKILRISSFTYYTRNQIWSIYHQVYPFCRKKLTELFLFNVLCINKCMKTFLISFQLTRIERNLYWKFSKIRYTPEYRFNTFSSAYAACMKNIEKSIFKPHRWKVCTKRYTEFYENIYITYRTMDSLPLALHRSRIERFWNYTYLIRPRIPEKI